MTAMREAMSSFFIFRSMWSNRAPISLAHKDQQKHKRTEQRSSLDGVFAFEHVIHGTVSFPVSGASTDIRVYNGAAELIQ
jgi:hypothetical protein